MAVETCGTAPDAATGQTAAIGATLRRHSTPPTKAGRSNSGSPRNGGPDCSDPERKSCSV
jgi:hypothetical protein